MTTPLPKRRGRRVMICARGQCANPILSRKLAQKLQALIEEAGLANPDHPQHVSCTLTNCLGVCSNGPVLIVHPEGVKYLRVDEAALERIFRRHLLGGQPVEE